MRKVSLFGAVLLAGSLTASLFGCASAPSQDVVDSVAVLQTNTHNLATYYAELIARSGPAAGQTKADWDRYVRHKTLLMQANTTLVDKVHTWTVTAGKNEEKTK